MLRWLLLGIMEKTQIQSTYMMRLWFPGSRMGDRVEQPQGIYEDEPARGIQRG